MGGEGWDWRRTFTVSKGYSMNLPAMPASWELLAKSPTSMATKLLGGQRGGLLRSPGSWRGRGAYRAENHILHGLEEVVLVGCVRFMGKFVEDGAVWELCAEVCDDAGFGVFHCGGMEDSK